MNPHTILDQITRLDKVLILGLAREGQSTYNFLHSKFPNLQIDTADQKDGPDYLKHLQNYKLIIKTPGINPHKPEILAAFKKGVVFTSHTQIFFELCPGKIIGVTGTKGKSTTSSLINYVLSQNHIKSILVGNIGKPALDYLNEITSETWVVMELSSYQLMDMTVSPHIAVLQNIYPDHLDYHESFGEYVEAKRNIARFQKPDDYFIYNNDFPLPAQTAELTPAHKLPLSLLDYDQKISTRLLGDHNKYNILPSIVIGKLLKIPRENIYSAIASFLPLDTRLQLVGTVRNIRFYEDTLATIPEATIAAIDALHSDVGTLIAGGHERKQDYSNLANKILNSGIKNLIIFPATGPRLAEEINKQVQSARAQPDAGNRKVADPRPGDSEHVPAAPAMFYTESMSEAVKFALDHTASGKICLLSPAAPSFTLFKDYRDEGAQYRQAIKNLKLP
jgi:UDP-N-acetylmuramoylalanine--D-glutamate ligase